MPAARPTEALIERTLRAWLANGLTVGGVEVRPDGTVIVLAERATAGQALPGANSCDGRFGKTR